MRNNKKGLSLIEILISTAIALILAAVGITNLIGFRANQKLDNTAQAITALLKTAQEKSINQEDSVRWGVSVYNASSGKDSFELFQVDEGLIASSSYGSLPGTSTDYRTISAGIEVVFPESSDRLNIPFNKFNGSVSSSTSITIQSSSDSSNQRTISISTNGRIDIE